MSKSRVKQCIHYHVNEQQQLQMQKLPFLCLWDEWDTSLIVPM